MVVVGQSSMLGWGIVGAVRGTWGCGSGCGGAKGAIGWVWCQGWLLHIVGVVILGEVRECVVVGE